MTRKRQIHDLGTFHKEAAGRGLTYAQAQIEETCDRIGPVRAPSDRMKESSSTKYLHGTCCTNLQNKKWRKTNGNGERVGGVAKGNM